MLGLAVSGEDISRPNKKIRTFSSLVDEYLEKASNGNRSWGETERILRYDAVRRWGSKPINEIQRADVAELIDEVRARTPSGARALFAQLRPMFRWRVERSFMDHNPTSELKPPAPPRSRDRILEPDEIKQIWVAADPDWFPFGPITRLLILTGQRISEVSGISEDELNGNEWIISSDRAKNKTEHVVDLYPLAQKTIQAVESKYPLIFSTTGRRPPSGFSKAKARLDARCTRVDQWRLRKVTRLGQAAQRVQEADLHMPL